MVSSLSESSAIQNQENNSAGAMIGTTTEIKVRPMPMPDTEHASSSSLWSCSMALLMVRVPQGR